MNSRMSEKRECNNVTAVILAGGLGSRLRSAVSDRPKVLAEVNGRPYLKHLFDQLIDADIEHAVLCTGHLADMVKKACGSTYGPMKLSYSQEFTQMGTGGALRLATPHIRSDTVLVMNGDSYCTAKIKDFKESHDDQGISASILLTEVEDTSRYGRVQFNDQSRVIRFDEKGTHSGHGWINAGIYLIQAGKLESIPEGRTVSLEHEIFPSWVEHGIYGYCSNNRFLDIGTPESYAEAESFFSVKLQSELDKA
ncbi:nucleotidyltransferase family protein [bacterium]|nr:nucleotidyltransferase family protein [bacterium]